MLSVREGHVLATLNWEPRTELGDPLGRAAITARDFFPSASLAPSRTALPVFGRHCQRSQQRVLQNNLPDTDLLRALLCGRLAPSFWAAR